MAFSSPEGISNGVVLMFSKDTGSLLWSAAPVQQIVGAQPSGLFGTALAMLDNVMLVGAPGTYADGSTVATGAAYFYQRGDSNEWVQFGPAMRGELGVYATDELFGSAVSASAIQRVAVGAPGSSVDGISRRGRLYVLEYAAEVSEWMIIEDIVGANEADALGSSVDISATGNFVVAGSPGNGPGFAMVYQYNAFSWLLITTIAGEVDGEAMGTSVKVLDNDGFIVAAGAPGYENGRGRVVVYERNALIRTYEPLGNAIVGDVGDRIGSANLLAGGTTESQVVVVVVGTALGQVRRYELDRSTLTWTQRGTPINSGYLDGGLLAISTSQMANTCVTSSNESSDLFDWVIT
jgi:hypothetical protein